MLNFCTGFTITIKLLPDEGNTSSSPELVTELSNQFQTALNTSREYSMQNKVLIGVPLVIIGILLTDIIAPTVGATQIVTIITTVLGELVSIAGKIIK